MRHIPKDNLPRSHVIAASHDPEGFREALAFNAVSFNEGVGTYTMRDGPDAGKRIEEPCFIFDKAFLSLLHSSTPFLLIQESVLVLSPYDHSLNGNPASLYYINGLKPDEPLGVFRSVPESVAINAGDFSCVGGRYFTCLPEALAREVGHRLFTRDEVEAGRIFSASGEHWPQPNEDVNASEPGHVNSPAEVIEQAGDAPDISRRGGIGSYFGR